MLIGPILNKIQPFKKFKICKEMYGFLEYVFFISVPEAPSQVSVIAIMETSLQVSWRQTDPLDLILQYMVQVKSGEGDWEQVNDTVQGTSVLVKNLNSFTSYSFRVRAKNGLGTSPHSQPSLNATTLEGGMIKINLIPENFDLLTVIGKKSMLLFCATFIVNINLCNSSYFITKHWITSCWKHNC